MTLITITGSISYSVAKEGMKIATVAGETIFAGAACVLKSDDKAYLAGTTIVTGTTQVGFDGFAMRDYAANEPITLIGQNSVVMLDGNAGLTTGKELYLSATAGVVSDARVATVDTPVAKAISSTAVRVLR